MGDQIHERTWSWNMDADAIEVRAADDGDGLTLSGYIAKFGEPTEVNDWAGTYVEDIRRGAFATTIAERGAGRIKMQFNHGHDPAFGQLPIGVWTELREDRKGLWGEGRIHDNWHTIPIRHAIESGALDGMSFKFKVISAIERAAKSATELDHRTLTEVALFEAGVVVNPAYEGTTVGIRSRALDLFRQGGAIVPTQEPVAPAGDSSVPEVVAGTPVGVTRRDLMRIAAPVLIGVTHVPDRNPSHAA